MSEQRTIVIMGVSGSGKSTIGEAVADRLGWSFCDADDHHPESNVAKMSVGVPLTDEDREPWLTELLSVADGHRRRGESLVLVCSALKADFRRRLLAADDVELVYLRGDRELIAGRLKARRDHFMGAEMLASQFAALEEPTGAFVVDASEAIDTIADTIVEQLGQRQ